jgi:homogentisate 1,2-dioxygenase
MSEGKQSDLQYMSGLGGYYSSEALPNSLPKGQNNPQICPYGLYAEQLSGAAFTTPRHKNLHSWLYRIRPSVLQDKMYPLAEQEIFEQFEQLTIDPNQLRWSPLDLPTADESIDFIEGMRLVGGAGDPAMKDGLAIYLYVCNKSMTNKAFYNSDGDYLIVPQVGSLHIKTEFGKMLVEPCEIAVIPRGVKFSIAINESCRGYIGEIFKGHFELPSLGPIGANGLANQRDFDIPVAFYEDLDMNITYELQSKFLNKLYTCKLDHSPFDVVAWHGSYSPFKYDLKKYCTVNSVSFDHLDPSIFTVLTCQTDEPGVAVMDFVIFPPRWMVAENTFRPPYYHRNCMSEYMGMIYGEYDAKGTNSSQGGDGVGKNEGFVPGGASLHSCMTSHGPDADAFIKASSVETLPPIYFDKGLAFMFESNYILKLAPHALTSSKLQKDYIKCWKKLPKLFNGENTIIFDWKKVKESLSK